MLKTLFIAVPRLQILNMKQPDTAYISNIKFSKIYININFSGRVPSSQQGWFVEHHISLKKVIFLTPSVTETQTCIWQQIDSQSDEINEDAWQIKLDHQFESLRNILIDRSAQFRFVDLQKICYMKPPIKLMVWAMKSHMMDENRKKKKMSASAPEEGVNKSALHI